MGDRAYVDVRLYGVAGHEQAIVDLFGDWSGSDGDRHDGMSDIHDGMTIVDAERSLGGPDEVGPALEALGVSYVVEQSSCCEFGAELRMFTPELGVFASDSDGQGQPVVGADCIDALIVRFVDTCVQTLCDALCEVTGQTHRRRFALLRAGVAAAPGHLPADGAGAPAGGRPLGGST